MPFHRLSLFIALLAVASGCGSGKKGPDRKEEEKIAKAASEIQSAAMRAGKAERFRKDGSRERLWLVEWESAELNYNEAGEFGGSMAGVKGEFFQKGESASSFRATKASAKLGEDGLQLTGGIEVTAKNAVSSLRCDKLAWNPSKNRLEASGKVTIETDTYVLGPFEVIYASPKLDEVGTPDGFRQLK